jgi:hypothetical protein
MSKRKSESNAPLIWFHLYDSSGQPYKGSTADFVELPPGSVIAQFKDAVKKKDRDEGEAAILTRFKSSQLIVYRDKDAFDKRDAPEKVDHVLLMTDSTAEII